EGSGSGLDADTLDGQDSGAFAGSVHTHSGDDITTGTVAEPRIDAAVARDAEIIRDAQARGTTTGHIKMLEQLEATAYVNDPAFLESLKSGYLVDEADFIDSIKR
ncbi:MAG: hypothetical protein R3313_00115, partial [Candidatus Saccharimonadales bacterium]|nr:hypothetical protein [Candidatus Saccharimonadales bacterium]